jgi:hypothetical protein
VRFLEKLVARIQNDENRMDLTGGHIYMLVQLIVKRRKSDEAAAALDSPLLFDLFGPMFPDGTARVNKLHRIAVAGGHPALGANAIRDYYRYIASWWAHNKISDLDFFQKPNYRTLHLLESLVRAAPDEECRGYFAAGPLENFIKQIVEANNDPQLTKAVLVSPELSLRLGSVWPYGIIAKLFKLAERRDTYDPKRDQSAQVTKKLAADYWANYQTMWAHDRVDKVMDLLDESSLQALTLLAQSAPSKRLLIKMAQGEMHTIVNGVAGKRSKAHIAKAVMDSPLLAPMVKYIGPTQTVKKFKKLAEI